jgi:hypothetical protein
VLSYFSLILALIYGITKLMASVFPAPVLALAVSPAPAPASQQHPALALPVSSAEPAPATFKFVVALSLALGAIIMTPFPVESPTSLAAKLTALRCLYALITGAWRFSNSKAEPYKAILLSGMLFGTVSVHIGQSPV